MLVVHHDKYERVLSQIARHKLKVDLYRPMVAEPVDINGKIEWQEKPAFENYLFVSTKLPKTETELSLTRLIGYINQLPLTPIILGEWIANITDEKLAEVRASVEKTNTVNRLRANSGDFASTYAGKTVQITSGAFGGTFGEVLGAAGAGMIAIQIALFDQPTRCRIKVADVRLV
jgi:hypothetical protein